MKKTRSLLNDVLILVVIFSNVSTVHAADRPKNTVTVEPASITIQFNPDEQQKVAMVTIHNDYDNSLDLRAEFKGIDEAGGRIIPVGEPNKEILDSLKLSETAFSVPANGTHFLRISASNTDSLSPGGHYATLVISPLQKKNTTANIQSEMSLGVFLVKRAGAINNIELTRNNVQRSLFSIPTSSEIELLNDGNTHVTPRASVRLIDSNGSVLFEKQLNESSVILLPQKKYSETIDFKNIKAGILPKKISFEVRYRADEINEAKIDRKDFWYIPKFYFLLLPLLLFGLVCLLAIKFKIFKKRK